MRNTSYIYIDVNLLIDKQGTITFALFANLLTTLHCNNLTKVRVLYQQSDLNPILEGRLQKKLFTQMLQTLDFFRKFKIIDIDDQLWDTTTSLDNPDQNAVFFSLNPELNRIARRNACETIVDTYGALNKEEVTRSISTILLMLGMSEQTVIIFLDFDETIIDGMHPLKTPEKPVIIQHAVDFVVNLINQIKERFPDEMQQRDALSRLQFQILSTRLSDENVEKLRQHNPAIPPHRTPMNQALPIFIDEIFYRTHVRIDLSKIHCLYQCECTLFVEQLSEYLWTLHDAVLYQPFNTALTRYKEQVENKRVEMQEQREKITVIETDWNNNKPIFKAEYVLSYLFSQIKKPKLVLLLDDQFVQRNAMKRITRCYPETTVLTIAATSERVEDQNKNEHRIGDIYFANRLIAKYNPHTTQWETIQSTTSRTVRLNVNVNPFSKPLLLQPGRFFAHTDLGSTPLQQAASAHPTPEPSAIDASPR